MGRKYFKDVKQNLADEGVELDDYVVSTDFILRERGALDLLWKRFYTRHIDDAWSPLIDDKYARDFCDYLRKGHGCYKSLADEELLALSTGGPVMVADPNLEAELEHPELWTL